MSEIFKEFMKNYNKLAKVNDKPLMRIAEIEERVDWYESGDELDDDIEEDDGETNET